MIMKLSLITVIVIGFLHYFRYFFSSHIQRKNICILNIGIIASGLLLALIGAIIVVNSSSNYASWINVLFLLPLPFAVLSLLTERLFFSIK